MIEINVFNIEGLFCCAYISYKKNFCQQYITIINYLILTYPTIKLCDEKCYKELNIKP